MTMYFLMSKMPSPPTLSVSHSLDSSSSDSSLTRLRPVLLLPITALTSLPSSVVASLLRHRRLPPLSIARCRLPSTDRRTRSSTFNPSSRFEPDPPSTATCDDSNPPSTRKTQSGYSDSPSTKKTQSDDSDSKWLSFKSQRRRATIRNGSGSNRNGDVRRFRSAIDEIVPTEKTNFDVR
ncbi:hypothetical protein U1Q18_009574 [Sarracenia purpurea var. burkii]